MNTIIENKEKELIIKKSKFIGISLEIDSKESADKFIIEYREKYKLQQVESRTKSILYFVGH